MCEFCTFEPGRMFNIYYQGGIGDFDKLDISMGKPYLTKFRKSRQILRNIVYECPRCGRKLTEERIKAIKATKKPVTIEAVKWDGENIEEIKAFAGGSYIGGEKSDQIKKIIDET